MTDKDPAWSTVPTKYRTLVNADRIRSSIKRTFTGRIEEIIGELLQNSQRAEAKKVEVDLDYTDESPSFTYRDDGCGLQNTEDYYALFCIGESDFSEEVQANQHPMGLGFHSLLAFEGVEEVRVYSGKWFTIVDCQRWWNDSAYYQSWYERLHLLEGEPYKGFKIVVHFKDPQTLDRISECLTQRYGGEPEDSERRKVNSAARSFPAIGYDDLLEVWKTVKKGVEIQKTPVETRFLPLSNMIPLVQATYEDCELTVYVPGQTYYSWNDFRQQQYVNWYGQMIPTLLGCPDYFCPYLKVRSGRPLDPIAPSRHGFVRNEKLKKYREFVEDAILEAVRQLDPGDPKLTSNLIRSLCNLFSEKRGKLSDFPWFVAKPIAPYEDNSSIEDIPSYPSDWQEQIYSVDDPPPYLLDYKMPVYLTQHAIDYEESCDCAFSGMLEEHFKSFPCIIQDTFNFAEQGLDERLANAFNTIVWRPGKPHEAFNEALRLRYLSGESQKNLFFERGEWALVKTKDLPELETLEDIKWYPVTEDVFLFEQTQLDFNFCHWRVGCEDPVKFLQAKAIAGFDTLNCDDDYTDRESYREEVESFIISYLGDIVPEDYTRDDLESFVYRQGFHQAALKSVEFFPDSVKVNFINDGEEQSLTAKLYGRLGVD